MPLLSPLYLERDPVSVIQGLFSFNLLYKLLPLYSLMRHFGFAAPQPRQSPDGSFLKNTKSFRLKRLLKLLPFNESVQLRLRFTAPAFGASPHKKIDIWTLIFKWTWINLLTSLPLYSLMRHFGSAVLRLSRVSRQMAPRNLTAVKWSRATPSSLRCASVWGFAP